MSAGGHWGGVVALKGGYSSDCTEGAATEASLTPSATGHRGWFGRVANGRRLKIRTGRAIYIWPVNIFRQIFPAVTLLPLKLRELRQPT